MSVRLSAPLARARIEALRVPLGDLAYRRLLRICDALADDHTVSLATVHDIIGPTASENAKSKAISSLKSLLEEAAQVAGVDIALAAHGATKLGAQGRHLDFRAKTRPAPQSPTDDVDRLDAALVTEQRATSRVVTIEYAKDDVESVALAQQIAQAARATELDLDDPQQLLAGELEGRSARVDASARVLIVSNAYLADHPECQSREADLPTLVVRVEPLPVAVSTTWMCERGHILFPDVMASLKSTSRADAPRRILDMAAGLVSYGPATSAELGAHPRDRAKPRNPGASILEIDSLDTVIDDAHAAPQWSDRERQVDDAPRGRPLQPALLEWLNDADGKRLCAVLGESGVGKTINAQMFYTSARQDEGRGLVFYFDLRLSAGFPFPEFRILQVENPGRRLSDALLERCMQSWRDNPYANISELKAAAREHASLWIVDGLDEALTHLSKGEGRGLGGDLLALTRELPKARMLLTCRDHYFESVATERTFFAEQHSGHTDTADYLAFRLLPFDVDQVERYVRGALGEESAGRALETIGSIQSLAGLATRPFNLKLMLDHLPTISERARSGGKVSVSWLYQLIVTDWLSRDEGKHQFQPTDKLRLMEHLAWWTWSRGTRGLAPGHLNDWLTELIAAEPLLARRYGSPHSAEEMLQEDLRTATFLVRRDDASESSEFRFAHTSLHEFFLARRLIDALVDGSRDPWDVETPSRETLDFMLSMLVDLGAPQPAIRRLASWGESFVERSSRLIMALAARAVDTGGPDIVLPHFDFGGANWRDLSIGAPTRRALNLRAARATRADLRGAHLYGIDVSHGVFDSALLDWARLDAAQALDARFDGATAAGAIVRGCRLDAAAKSHLVAGGAHLIDARGGGVTAPPRDGLRAVVESVSGHLRSVLAVAFSPDGTHLATASTVVVVHSEFDPAAAPRVLLSSPMGAATWVAGKGGLEWRVGDTSERVWMRWYDEETGRLVEQGPAEQYLGLAPS